MLRCLALRITINRNKIIYCQVAGLKQQKLHTAAQIVSKAANTVQVVNKVQKWKNASGIQTCTTSEALRCDKKQSARHACCILGFHTNAAITGESNTAQNMRGNSHWKKQCSKQFHLELYLASIGMEARRGHCRATANSRPPPH